VCLLTTIRFGRDIQLFISAPQAEPKEIRLKDWNSARDEPISIKSVSDKNSGEFSLRLDFRLTSTEGYPNLFQTSDVNEGLRLEIAGVSPNSTAALIWRKSPGQFGSIILTPKLSINSWHKLALSVRKDHGIECNFDGQLFKNLDPVSFRIDSIKIGQGFSAERKFRGDIRNAVVLPNGEPTSSASKWAIPLAALILFLALFSVLRHNLSIVDAGAPLAFDSCVDELRSYGIWIVWVIGIVALFVEATGDLFWQRTGIPYPESSPVGFVAANISQSVLFVCGGYEFARLLLFEPTEINLSMRALRRYSFVIDLGFALLTLETAATFFGPTVGHYTAQVGLESLGLWPLRYLALFWLAVVFIEWASRLFPNARPRKCALFVVVALLLAKMIFWKVLSHKLSSHPIVRFDLSSDLMLLGLSAGALYQMQTQLTRINLLRGGKTLAILLLSVFFVLLIFETQSLSGRSPMLSAASERLISLFWGTWVALCALTASVTLKEKQTAAPMNHGASFARIVVEHRFASFLGILIFVLLTKVIWTASGTRWLNVLEFATLAIAAGSIALNARSLSLFLLMGKKSR
jgi:hypothetical protein